MTVPGQSSPTRTGETVFGDRALRFRSLTLNAADLAMLEAYRDQLGQHEGARP
jgi:hypothetical protein